MALAVCCRMAMTDLIGAPAATAKVRLSWKLMPQSAWPAARRVSGAVWLYGITLRLMPAAVYQPLARATKNPVWSVFGVQSSASRTVVEVGGTGVGPRLCVGDGDGDVAPEADADASTEADSVGEGSTEAVAVTDGSAPVRA